MRAEWLRWVVDLVRFRVAFRGQVELVEVTGAEIEIGRESGCALRIEHPSVALRHARILVRRGRLILVDLRAGPTRVAHGDGRLLAPLVLQMGEAFELGDVTLSAWRANGDDRSWVGRSLDRGRVLIELESGHRRLRRYAVEDPDDGRAELVVADSALDRGALAVWLERMRGARDGPTMSPCVGAEWIDGRACLLEVVPRGVRLAALVQALESRAIRLPLDALLVIFARLAEHVDDSSNAIGAHGAIDPRNIQLGVDGSVRLLRPGPTLVEAEVDDALIAPERRLAPAASLAGDVFALGVMAKALLRRHEDVPGRVRAVFAWLAHFDPARRPRTLEVVASELRSIAQALGRDPTSSHVARTAHILSPTRERLAHVGPASG